MREKSAPLSSSGVEVVQEALLKHTLLPDTVCATPIRQLRTPRTNPLLEDETSRYALLCGLAWSCATSGCIESSALGISPYQTFSFRFLRPPLSSGLRIWTPTMAHSLGRRAKT